LEQNSNVIALKKRSSENDDLPEMNQIKQDVKYKKNKNLLVNENLTMPDYKNMDSPIIKDSLKKYGLKVLPKKLAIKKLTEIYEYTHRNSLQRSFSSTNFKELEHENSSNSKIIKTNKTLKKTNSDIGLVKKNNQEEKPVKIINILPEANYPPPLDEELLELINFEKDPDNENHTKSSKDNAKKKDLFKKYMDERELKYFVNDFIKKNQNILLSVLNYEPLVFDEFLLLLQSNLKPRKVSNQILMKILDEFCITFTLKNFNTRGGNTKKPK
jgi:hypothetical protein